MCHELDTDEVLVKHDLFLVALTHSGPHRCFLALNSLTPQTPALSLPLCASHITSIPTCPLLRPCTWPTHVASIASWRFPSPTDASRPPPTRHAPHRHAPGHLHPSRTPTMPHARPHWRTTDASCPLPVMACGAPGGDVPGKIPRMDNDAAWVVDRCVRGGAVQPGCRDCTARHPRAAKHHARRHNVAPKADHASSRKPQAKCPGRLTGLRSAQPVQPHPRCRTSTACPT